MVCEMQCLQKIELSNRLARHNRLRSKW